MEKDKVTLPPSQQEPSQRDLVAEEDPDPLVSGGWCWLHGCWAWDVCPACASHVCGACVHQPSHAWVHESVTTVCKGFVPPRCHPSMKCLLAAGGRGSVRCRSLLGRGMLAVCAGCVLIVHTDWVWVCV